MIYTTIVSSVIILIILMMRLIFLKKGNPNFIYFLWFFAFVRMIIPVNIPVGRRDNGLNVWGNIEYAGNVLRIIYYIGAFILLMYIVVNSIYFWLYVRKLRNIDKSGLGIKIYETSKYNCLFGIINPKILIARDFNSNDRFKKYIIMHEEEHYKVKDNLLKLVRTAGLICQWYNPLAWVAFIVSEEDCEVACDYRVALKLTKKEKADYTESILLALENSRRTTAFTSNMSVYGRMIKKRIQSIFNKKSKKEFIWIYQFIFVITVLSLLRFNVNAEDNGVVQENNNPSETVESEIIQQTDEDLPIIRVDYLESAMPDEDFDISSYYCKVRETVCNKYWIDENGSLWATGRNDYGQIGNGERNSMGELQEEPYKVSENAVSVDASVNGYFMVYLTKNGDLFGVGSNRLGLLGQPYEIELSDMDYKVVTKPVLLMQNVSYVSAGRESIVALKDDGSVWFWGEYKSLYKTHASWGFNGAWREFEDEGNPDKILVNSPTKVMDDCIYAVTGNTHGAAITKNGELYTWGLNIFGDCGVSVGDDDYVRKPTKVLENGNMVWVEKIDERRIKNEYRIDGHYRNVYNFNVFAVLNDGTVLASGEGIGEKKKTIQITGDLEEESTHVYTDSFIPVKIECFPHEEYCRILEGLEWGTSFEEAKEYLDSYNINYYEDLFSLDEGTENEYSARALNIENSSYFLEFDKERKLCRIRIQDVSTRDGRFQLGMTYSEVESNVEVELVKEQDKDFNRPIYRTKEAMNGIYYGFVFEPETEKLILVIESSDSDVFSGEF